MERRIDFWSFRGTISRTGYVVAGAVLFAIKYGLDLAVSMKFGRDWSPLNYLSPKLNPLWAESSLPTAYVAWLLVVAAPFAFVGVVLSARRLRDMGVHPFWAGLFFLPFLHWAFFLALAVAPPRREPESKIADPYRGDVEPPSRPVSFLERILPRTRTGAFLFGTVTSLALGFTCFIITAKVDKVLGGWLFVGVPFGMGFISGFAASAGARAGAAAAVGNAIFTQLIGIVLLINLAWEGAACIVMAIPIISALTIAGAAFGHFIGKAPRVVHAASLCVMTLPAFVANEKHNPPEPVDIAVVSEVTIHASPEVVFRQVVSFRPIAEPARPIFAIVAMPLEARIENNIRRCVFTNGTFVEPIEVMDAPRELTFGVASQPANLDPYMDVRRGQFLLTSNPDGTTKLRGTTWYRLKVHPAPYWRLWTDTLLHAIHHRVLDHVKKISENPNLPVAPPPPIPKWIESAQSTCKCTSK